MDNNEKDINTPTQDHSRHKESMADVVAAILSGTVSPPVRETASKEEASEANITEEALPVNEPAENDTAKEAIVDAPSQKMFIFEDRSENDRSEEHCGETVHEIEAEVAHSAYDPSDECETEDETLPEAEAHEAMLTEGAVASTIAVAAGELESIKHENSTKAIQTEDTADVSKDDKHLPSGFGRRKAQRGNFGFFIAVYAVFLAVMTVVFLVGVNDLIGIYDEARPEKVVDEYVEYLSGNKLYNDIANRIKDSHTEFETEYSAATNAMQKLSVSSEKNYYEVSSTENGILYDVYSGNTHLYSLMLGKKGEARPFGINFWEVTDARFIDKSIELAAEVYTFSAPADAEIFLNGVKIAPSYITNDNYRFFIGSVWESDIPEKARCVQYTVSGLYGTPEIRAVIDGEELEVYSDEGTNDFHAKYPTSWVNSYTIEVPSGAAVHVNGVLATRISSHGKAPDTEFDTGKDGTTDIYVIEGLFQEPRVTASFGTLSLGEPTIENKKYTYDYIDEMYTQALITVPKGAAVTVNGILLTADNSQSTDIPFSEWSTYGITLNNYMPTELKTITNVAMPEFVRYTVGELYSEPEIKVTVDGTECSPFHTESGETTKTVTYMYDVPAGIESSSVVTFADSFARAYIKYITEGCYGIRDDIELRKNFYENWVKYLSYIVPSSLCYDNALDSYSDVEYRPTHTIYSQSYNITSIMKYTDDIYFCRIICTVQDSGDEQPVISIIDALIVRTGGSFKIWNHDTIPA